MKTVYRYELTSEECIVNIPMDAKILTVGIVKDWDYSSNDELNDIKTVKEVISIWALVDTDNSLEKRKFLIFGTGANMDATETYKLNYIGTVNKKNQYAFHVFESDICSTYSNVFKNK